MAEGGQVAGRKATQKKKCSPCNRKGKLNEAETLCTQCNAFFCHDCSEQHDSLLSDHLVQEIGSDEAKAAISQPTEMCPDHAELMKLYCKDHDEICCGSCVALDHRSCNEVIYIATSTADLIETNILETVTKQLSDTIKNLESIKLTQQATQAGLDDSRQNCLDDVDDYRADLLNLVEKLVQASKYDIERRYTTFTNDLQRYTQDVEGCLNDLIVAKDRLDSCHDNDAQRFVELKKSQKSVKATTKVTRDAKEKIRIKGFYVSLDKTVEKVFTEVKSLTTTIEPIRIKRKHVINVSVKGDKETCIISGACVLNDGSVLLTDFENKSLKRLSNTTLSITDHCSLKSTPWDVCCINDDEAVMADWDRLVVVSLKPRLKLTQTLTMSHFCYNVAYSNSELFVTDKNKTLYVYNMQGIRLRTVSSDPTGHDVFSDCRHITFSESGDKVHVADRDKGIITLDRQGNVLDTRLYSEVRGTQGVCRDGSGGLFICGLNNVVHLGRRGNVLSEVVSRSDALEGPNSVSYDCQNRRLYVSLWTNNSLLVFDV